MRKLGLFLLFSCAPMAFADSFAMSSGFQQPLRDSSDSYFSKYDKNRDGFITDREFFDSSLARRSPSIAGKIFDSMDKNGDGVITEKEVGKKSKTKGKKK